MAPVLIAGLHRALDQQAPEAGAVDEKVGLQASAVIRDDSRDVARSAVLDHIRDSPLVTGDAPTFRDFPEEACVEAGVEMIGVFQTGQHGPRVWRRQAHSIAEGGDGREIVVPQGRSEPLRVRSQPDLGERHGLNVHSDGAERMHIAIPQGTPVDKFDAQFERRLCAPHELGLVYACQGVERQNRRYRRFAHPDRSDLLRLDEGDFRRPAAGDSGQGDRSHPSGCAAAYDEDTADGASTGRGRR